MNNTGKFLIVAGLLITAAGVIVLFRDSIPFVKNIGRLPGDILIKKENFTFYFPLTTGIVISIIVSLFLYLISRLR